jgi:3-oxoacyl-[acyl-carrier-protein] synthase II
MRRRVVVTGLGAVTPVGNDVATTWQGLLNGVSGAAPITHFDATDFAVRFACEVKQFDPSVAMDRKEVRRSDLFTQYAMVASVQAMADAGLSEGGCDPDRLGVIVGSGIGGIETFETQHTTLRERGNSKISAFFVPMYIIDIAAGVISMRFNARGPNYGVVSACATGAHAIGSAFRAIQYGDADIIITGGAEAAVTPMSIGGFGNMTALSTRNDDPAHASRPFDAQRDGFVLGEGAGIVILEALDHALARGAHIYGEVVGYGATGDAYHLTGQPQDHEGLQRSMRLALKDAGAAPTDVHYINAHGTSTPLNDPNESRAIRAVFGTHADALHVSSTKSCHGHMLGATAAVEFVACALAIRDQIVPPTINLETPDPECDLHYSPNAPTKRAIELVLSNSSGFGGHNATLALKRWHA